MPTMESTDACIHCGTAPCSHPLNPVFAEYDKDRERYIDTLLIQRSGAVMLAALSTVLWVVFLVLLVVQSRA